METENDVSELFEDSSRPKTPFLRSSVDRDRSGDSISLRSSSKIKSRSSISKSNKLTVVAEVYNSESKESRAKKVSDNDSGSSSVVNQRQKRIRRTSHQQSKRRLVLNGTSVQKDIETLPVTTMDADNQENMQKEQEERNWRQTYQTSDYSSEEDTEAKGSPGVAFYIYKQAGEWWNKFPKTDYTYSPISPHRQYVAPGVLAMPNMSRRSIHKEDMASSKSIRSVTHLTESRSRWFSNSDSGARAPKKLESWTVESDVDEVDEVMTSQSSASLRLYLTRIVTSIWTFFSSVYNSVTDTVLNVFQRNGLQSTTRRTEDSTVISWFKRLDSFFYISSCYMMITDSWLLSRLFRSRSQNSDFHEDSSKPSRLKYFALLLIPLLLLAGWWFCFGDDSPLNSALSVINTSISSSLGWLSSPFYINRRMKDEIKPATTQSDPVFLSHGGVNIEHIVQRVINIEQSQQELLGNMELEREKWQQALNYKDDVLVKQQQLYDQLTEELVHVRKQVELSDAQLKNKRDAGILYTSSPLWRRKLRELDSRMRILQEDRLYLTRKIEECCKSTHTVIPFVAIEDHVTKFLSGLFSSEGEAEGNIPSVQTWIKRLFVAKDDLEARLSNITTSFNLNVGEAYERTAQTVMSAVSEKIRMEFLKQQAIQAATKAEESRGWVDSTRSGTGNCNLTAADVKNIVNSALITYDADKTGMVDYALESSGGSILSTRCTETYNAKAAIISWFGLSLWSPSSNPRIVIQPGVQPGECWAFNGAQGYLVITLSGRVKVTAFSLEHIPVSLSPSGNIDSAPRDFSVWGLENEHDTEGILLGRYRYQHNGTSLQFFSVQRSDSLEFNIVELRIETNHGNLEYTCLYRFRVHGVLTSK